MTEYKNEDYVEDVDEDYKMKQEMLLRQSKLLFPEVEEWVLELAVKAHLNMEKLGDKYQEKTKEECEEYKKKYFNELEYKTVF